MNHKNNDKTDNESGGCCSGNKDAKPEKDKDGCCDGETKNTKEIKVEKPEKQGGCCGTKK